MTAPHVAGDGLKASIRSAIVVVSAMTLRDLARRMGLAGTTLYHYASPRRRRYPTAGQVTQLAALLREDASRLEEAARLLERAASQSVT
jgi:AcrR family transcriptional regulator